MWMKQYTLAIHMLLPFWPVDIFTFCWTYSFNILKTGLNRIIAIFFAASCNANHYDLPLKRP